MNIYSCYQENQPYKKFSSELLLRFKMGDIRNFCAQRFLRVLCAHQWQKLLNVNFSFTRIFLINAALLLDIENALSDWIYLTSSKCARTIDCYLHPIEIRLPRGWLMQWVKEINDWAGFWFTDLRVCHGRGLWQNWQIQFVWKGFYSQLSKTSPLCLLRG